MENIYEHLTQSLDQTNSKLDLPANVLGSYLPYVKYAIEAIPYEYAPSPGDSVTSTSGGINPVYERLKITGKVNLEDLKSKFDQGMKQIEALYPETGRTSARVLVPNTTLKEIKQLFTEIELNYCFPINIDLKNKEDVNNFNETAVADFIVYVGTNQPNRQTAGRNNLDLDVVEKKANQINTTNPELERNFLEYNNFDYVPEILVNQITFYLKRYFNPAYTVEIVNEILQNPDFPKTILVDELGNIIAFGYGEPDGLGGIEITEIFAFKKSGRQLVRSLVDKCWETHPNLTVYAETNMSESGMPITMIREGAIQLDPKFGNGVIPKSVPIDPLLMNEIGAPGFSDLLFLYFPKTL